MKWNDIHDPKGEVEVRATFEQTIGQIYSPETIQKLINENGLEVAVDTVNEHLRREGIFNGLMIVEYKGRKMLIDFTATLDTNL